ncbi:MAG: glycerate kinase [Phycisphaerales bacterium]|nr:glycerate kinase [Phycisphaerales bacterium]
MSSAPRPRFDSRWNHVLCAPDGFKESISSPNAARAMARGLDAAIPGCTADVCPIADGGEGSVETLIAASGGRLEYHTVMGPRGEPVSAPIGWIDTDSQELTAVIGLADASGLALLPTDQRDPTQTTTFGTGELMLRAIRDGAQRLILGLGGSATCDGAAGLAQAMGVRFLNADGAPITSPLTGGTLSSIARIERCANVPPITVICDVTNPLLGSRGSAATYGPQKGATPSQVMELDAQLAHLAAITGGDVHAPGAGAAGGAGFGVVTLLGAVLARGIDVALDAVGFDDRLRRADIVLTGEGRLDAQSQAGKAVMGVAERAGRAGVRTIAIVGDVGEGWSDCVDPATPTKLLGVLALTDAFDRERALREPAACIESLVMMWARGVGLSHP